jgi:hypothetical protein
MEAQSQREQQYDETFRSLSPNQQFEIMREKAKANTAREERNRASEEVRREQWGAGKETIKWFQR